MEALVIILARLLSNKVVVEWLVCFGLFENEDELLSS